MRTKTEKKNTTKTEKKTKNGKDTKFKFPSTLAVFKLSLQLQLSPSKSWWPLTFSVTPFTIFLAISATPTNGSTDRLRRAYKDNQGNEYKNNPQTGTFERVIPGSLFSKIPQVPDLEKQLFLLLLFFLVSHIHLISSNWKLWNSFKTNNRKPNRIARDLSAELWSNPWIQSFEMRCRAR